MDKWFFIVKETFRVFCEVKIELVYINQTNVSLKRFNLSDQSFILEVQSIFDSPSPHSSGSISS